METNDFNLPNAQTMAIERGKVFSKILLYYFYERIWLFAMKKIYKKELQQNG